MTLPPHTAAGAADPVRQPGFNPFPGLRPFREDEEYLYFGREAQTDALVNRLAATRFLAVVGTSGSGKSSLVNCGLCPALHRGQMAAAGSAWRVARLRPGSAPLRELAEALAAPGLLFPALASGEFTQAELIESTLRASKLGLVDLVTQARLPAGTQLLLVVDQFEELFRYRALGAGDAADEARAREDATAFVNLLLEIPQQPALQIHVVLTMRSDFLGDCAQFYGLPEAINRGQYLVPRLTREERRRAITGPIAVGGASIDPVLLTRLLNDVGDNPDQLSQLQHALNRTWAHWRAQSERAATAGEAPAATPIEMRHYEAIGTIAQALNQHAEDVYESLPEGRARAWCEAVFRAITDRRADARGTRRPTRFDTLCAITGAPPDELVAVIAPFRDPRCAFLMPPDGEAVDAASVIDISHESLMRVWARLRQWGDDEAQSARILRRIAKTAELNAAGQANLLRNPELQVAIDWRERQKPNPAWAGRYHPGLAAALALIDRSEAARVSEETREAQRAANERALEQQLERTRRLRRASIAGIAIASLVAAGFAYLLHRANESQRVAQRERVQALEAQRIAEEALARARRWGDQRDQAQQQLDAAIKAVPALAATLEAAAVTQPIVYIQTPAGGDRSAAEALRKRLLASGYRAPGIEAVKVSPRSFELRYFRDRDRPHAEKLGALIQTWEFGALQVRMVKGFESQAAASQYEIWFPQTTAAPRPSR